MSRDDVFSRWSDRRAKVAREEAEAAEVRATPETEAAPPEPKTEAEEDALLAQLGLPRPEDVTGAEIKKFLARGVPEIFRRRALRALWRSNPTLAVLDGLNDYDDDFTLPEFNQKVVATAYQVGKGIVREIEAVVGSDDEAVEAEAEIAEPLTAVRPPAEDEAATEEIETVEVDAEVEEEIAEPAFAPKRMSFDT